LTGFTSKRAQARDKFQGEDMSKELLNIIDGYSDLLIRVLELDNQEVLGDVLDSMADTDALIDQGILR
jgi:hypothetical protein